MPELYSAGECPVCFDSGALIGLVSIATERIILYCPLCGVAWHTHPRGKLDAVLSLADAAPKGVAVPDRDELDASTLGPFEDRIHKSLRRGDDGSRSCLFWL